jgi:hypothetical protein
LLTVPPLAVPALAAAQGAPGRPLVVPGVLLSPLTLSRAQVSGVRSTGLDADDLTWAEYAADVPRFVGSARRLLVEGQRSNGIRNPRAEGAAPSTLPTFWTMSNTTNGITGTVVGQASYAGLTGVEIEYSGTATASAALFCNFETTTGVVAAPGQVWTASVFQRVSSGTPPNGTNPQIRIIERDSSGNALVNHNTTAPAPSAALQRVSGTSGVFGASAARVNFGLSVAFLNGTTANCRVQFLWPQLEEATFASSPILPPVGTPGASTRGADLITAALSDLGIPASGACTVLWSGMLPQAPPTGLDQTLLTLSDGTDSNRIRLRNTSGGNSIVGGRVTGGSAADAAAAGTMTPGTSFRAGLTHDGAGRAAFSVNGGAAQAVTGAPTAFTSLHLGNNVSGTAPMFGQTAYLRVIPAAVPDATLAALVAAMPT